MTFNIINLETWDRKEYFNHYFNQQTTFSVTKEFDITLLKSMIKNKGYKLYPALIYIIVNIINQNKVFRTGINSEGNLGYWDKLNPLYTVFNKETEKFSNIWTESNVSFNSFYNSYKSDLLEYKDKNEMFPKKPIPENTVPISMIPWIDFSSFNLPIVIIVDSYCQLLQWVNFIVRIIRSIYQSHCKFIMRYVMVTMLHYL